MIIDSLKSVVALTAFFAAPVTMQAQANGNASTRTAEPDTLVYRVAPVVVTATRGPRALLRTPQPVVVIQRRDLREQAPNTVTDLFRSKPGLDVAGVGVNQGRPEIRGLRGQRILLLEDGLRLNNSRRQSDFGEVPALVDVQGVERVEVVRGPASVLYGSDAIGGVVNVITRVPQLDGLHGSGSLRYGDVESQRTASGRVYGRYDGLTVRAGGTVRTADAYMAPAGTFGQITLNQDALVSGTGAEDRTFDVRLGYEPQGRHSVFAKVERYESDGSGFGSVDPALYDPTGTEIRITYPFQDFTRLSTGYRGQRLDNALADQVEVLAYGQENDRQLRFGIGPFGIGPGMSMEMDNLNTTDIRSYGARAEARKLAASGLLLTYGVDAWRDRAVGTDENNTIITGAGPTPIESVDNRPQLPDATYLSLGVFMQGEVEATDRLSFVGGARWQHAHAETFETAGLPGQTPVSISDGTLVAALNTLFSVSDEVTLVGAVGRAFRSPNLIERFFDGATPEGAGYQVRNPGLSPETSLNVDVGARFQNRTFNAEAFAFRNVVHDGIRVEALGYSVGGFPAYQNTNVDELLFRGIEVGGGVRFGDGFALDGSYTRMDAEDVKDVENPVGESFSSKVAGSLSYEAPSDRLWASAEVRHNGDRKDVDLGTANPVGDFLPAFTVVNLRGGVVVWRSDAGTTHRVDVALTNLTNTLYAEFSNVAFFRPEPKRNLTVSWSVSF